MKPAKSIFLLLIICCGLFLVWGFSYGGWRNIFQGDNVRITIVMPHPPGNKDAINFGYRQVGAPTYGGIRLDALAFKMGKAKWSARIKDPHQVYTGDFLAGQNTYWLVEAGDDIIVSVERNELKFTGTGAERFKLQHRIKEIEDSLYKRLSNPGYFQTKSLADYLEWNNNLNERLKIVVTLIESYRSKLSPFAYVYIRDNALDDIVEDRSTKFNSFLKYARETGMSLQNICDIYDSTYKANTTEAMLPSPSRSFLGSWDPIKFEVARRYSFDRDDVHVNTDLKRYLLFYELALKTYQGLAREKFLVEFLTEKMIGDIGFGPETEAMLNRYYAESGYPEYKKYTKEYEKKARVLKNGKAAPAFTLSDAKGSLFTEENLTNKVAVLNFWSAGNMECSQMKSILENIAYKFKSDSGFILLNISDVKNKSEWLASVNQGKYAPRRGVHLYTGGQGRNHPVNKAYNVLEYPRIYVVDGNGNIIQNPLPNPTKDNGAQLSKLIAEQLVLLKDGPYVIHEKKSISVHSINGSSVNTTQFTNTDQCELSIQTDEYNKTLGIRLKKSIDNEPSEFLRPQKLLILSDIEGSFSAFRKLLRSGGVIDENYNWTFSNGHLVFIGDMFGEGGQITECLWLIYSLEEKAKAAGGYVHFILGNNEIVSISNGYAHEKYRRVTGRMNKSYIQLYSYNSELGRWLRTKNIIEKIGDLLFVHGGISPEVNHLPLTISEINELARPWLDKDSIARQSLDRRVALLFNYKDKLSPFLFKGYYLDKEMKVLIGGKKGVDTVYKTTPGVVDETLSKFGVSRIITGHTVVAYGNNVGDTISVHYDSKVLNTDTRHLLNRSEALLIEGDRFYRVNSSGEKIALYLRPSIYSTQLPKKGIN